MREIKQRFIILDSLRGLAALLVFMYHMPNLTFITSNKFITSSGIFVDLFFILSGFVIYHNYKNNLKTFTEAKSFLTKRIKRLYPLHFYTLMVLLLVEFIKLLTFNILPYKDIPFSGNSLEVFFTNLFLLNSTPLFNGFTWNGQSWSISAELFCYLLFIIVSLFFFKTKKRTLITSSVIIVLSYLFFFLKYENFNILINSNYSFIRAFIGFFLGILAYLLKQKLILKPHLINTVVPSFLEFVALILIAYITIFFKPLHHYYFIYHAVFVFVIFVFSYERGIVSKLLFKPIFQKLGLWSYSIYLNHTVGIIAFDMIFIKLLKVEGYILIFAELLLIVAVCLYSALTYKYIEKRFYKPQRKKRDNLVIK